MTDDPVALALLRRLAELRPSSDPLHEFARTVLSGEASLRAAADHAAFAEAFLEALRDFDPSQLVDPPVLSDPPPRASAGSV